VRDFSAALFIIAIAIGLVWVIGASRYSNLFTATIEATELGHNPWPAPGDQTDVANEPSRNPSSAGVPLDNSKTGAANGDRPAASR